MPVIPSGDLNLLRSNPQTSKMGLVIQQPMRYDSDTETFNTSDAIWFGTVRVAPAVDPITSIAVTADAAAVGVTIFDGMTVMISSTKHGRWERGIVRAHGDQTVVGAGANDTLYIAVSSDLSGVQVGDFIVVLDEFRPWTRYPKITEAAGVLTWFKDYGFFRDSIGVAGGDIALTWAQLSAVNDAARAEASMPAVPIMGPHCVKFIDPDVGNVNVDFDWSDSYATSPTPAPGAAVNAWNSNGETDHIGGAWNDNVQNPAAKTYSVLSGLRGFRTWLELGTDATDPIVEFRRGVRFVFTLRRPEQAQAGDPSDAQPITDFEVSTIDGAYDNSGWRATIRVYSSQALEYKILPGALVILFTDDVYGSTSGSIGPNSITLADRANIVMVGHIADNSITEDSESGDVTFEIVGTGDVMELRENYPVPIENDGTANNWFKTPSLTVDRAAHHYVTWHTNLKLIADYYQSNDTKELKAMDFLASDAYAAVDDFIWDRIFARLLCDRFGRFTMDVNLQMQAVGSGTTLFTLTSGDWIGEISADQVINKPTSTVDLGGLFINAGLVVPFLSHAPGDVSAYQGTHEQMMSLALASQANLNILSGRLLAYRNNEWPRLTLRLAGNWRVFDIWPQEYIVVNETLVRHEFSSDKFIVREVSFEYSASEGSLITTLVAEMETDGPAGVTVDIPEDLPKPPWQPPPWPPGPPPDPGGGGEDIGRRIVATDAGVFVTDEIGAVEPYWYGINTGFSTVNDQFAYGLARDPFNWWTAGATTKRLWVGTRTGVWRMDDFPYGTWVQIITYLQMINLMGFVNTTPNHAWNFRFNFSIEIADKFAFVCSLPSDTGAPFWFDRSPGVLFVAAAGALVNGFEISSDAGAGPGVGWNDVKFAQHSGGMTIYGGENQGQFAVAFDHARLWRSVNGGFNYTQLDISIAFPDRGLSTTVSIPYVDAANPDAHVFWGTEDVWRVSHDQGNTWTNLPNMPTDRLLVGTAGTPLRIFMPPDNRLDLLPCQWTNDGGVIWTDLPTLVLDGLNNNFAIYSTFTVWNGDTLHSVLVGGVPTGANPAPNYMYYWQQGYSDWVSKEGNLLSYGVTHIYDIDRDSEGAP